MSAIVVGTRQSSKLVR